jgi:hypothetical protein
MNWFGVLSDELLFIILEKVSQSSPGRSNITEMNQTLQLRGIDLRQSLLVCRRFNVVGTPLLDRHLTYPVSPSCARCHSTSNPVKIHERQRLKLIQILLDPSRAARLLELTVTDTDKFCRCHYLDSRQEREREVFNQISVDILTALLGRAENIRQLQ